MKNRTVISLVIATTLGCHQKSFGKTNTAARNPKGSTDDTEEHLPSASQSYSGSMPALYLSGHLLGGSVGLLFPVGQYLQLEVEAGVHYWLIAICKYKAAHARIFLWNSLNVLAGWNTSDFDAGHAGSGSRQTLDYAIGNQWTNESKKTVFGIDWFGVEAWPFFLKFKSGISL